MSARATNVRHELPRLRRDAQRRPPGAPQFVHKPITLLLLREVHVQALAARQARRAEGQPRLSDGPDRVLERPHRPRAGAAVRSYLNPRAEISSTFAHFSVSPLPRLTRTVCTLAALLDELEQQALAHGRVRHVDLELQASRVWLRPHKSRISEREGVAGLEARRETVDEIQCFFSEELRFNPPEQHRQQLVGVPISSFPAALLLVCRCRLNALAAGAAP
jgi:hypothetical protein